MVWCVSEKECQTHTSHDFMGWRGSRDGVFGCSRFVTNVGRKVHLIMVYRPKINSPSMRRPSLVELSVRLVANQPLA